MNSLQQMQKVADVYEARAVEAITYGRGQDGEVSANAMAEAQAFATLALSHRTVIASRLIADCL